MTITSAKTTQQARDVQEVIVKLQIGAVCFQKKYVAKRVGLRPRCMRGHGLVDWEYHSLAAGFSHLEFLDEFVNFNERSWLGRLGKAFRKRSGGSKSRKRSLVPVKVRLMSWGRQSMCKRGVRPGRLES